MSSPTPAEIETAVAETQARRKAAAAAGKAKDPRKRTTPPTDTPLDKATTKSRKGQSV